MGRFRRWAARMEYASEGLVGCVEVGVVDVRLRIGGSQ